MQKLFLKVIGDNMLDKIIETTTEQVGMKILRAGKITRIWIQNIPDAFFKSTRTLERYLAFKPIRDIERGVVMTEEEYNKRLEEIADESL